jgi:hypothetical protein
VLDFVRILRGNAHVCVGNNGANHFRMQILA